MSIPHAPGVYRITCTPSKKIYIGSTGDLARRWPEHRKELRGNRHPNRHLQSAWNKYGESQFQYEVIEIILASFVTEREQYWIDRTKSSDRRHGFNNAPVAYPISGWHLSDSHKQAIALRSNKTWEGFIDPDGNEVTIVGLTSFCREHNLSYTSMSRMAIGHKSALQHKGWTHRNADRPRQQFKDLSGFIRPDGTREPTPESVQALCQRNGLKWKSVYALISGIIQTHQGWRYDPNGGDVAFDATIVHWKTLTGFADALATIKRPAWVKKICHHNTYKPDETTWRGMASMFALRDYYRDTQKWPSGPHLFLAAAAPNPADTGIFQLTPITRPGTHAGACNAYSIGIENVGDFESRPPTAAQYTLLLLVTRLIMEHWGLPPESITVHNECMQRTCPGKYLTGTQLRAALNTAPPKPPAPTRYRVRGLPVYERSDRTGPQWGTLKQDEIIEIDDPKTGHLKDSRGFIRFDPDTLESL